MAGNLIKGGYTVVNKNKSVVIDSNEAVKKRLEELSLKMAKEAEKAETSEESFADDFVEGLDPLFVERLVSDDENVNIIGNDNNIDDSTVLDINSDNAETKDNVITNEEANAILEEARAKAEEIKANAEAAGYEEGYNKGLAEGEAAAEDSINAKIAEIENRSNQKINEANQRSEAFMESLEPILVEKICDIYEQVIGIEVADNKDLIIKLINKAMSEVDTSKAYTIHVSKDDIENVSANLNKILDGIGILPENITLVEDNSVPENGCLVESELGIFDCGLGTQMSLLKKQLKLLSIE